MDFLLQFIDLFLHLDTHLQTVIFEYGQLTYFILFLIVFCETGLVVTPFLPGDSLLFAVGALSALGMFDPALIAAMLFLAAVLGDAINYAIGKKVGSSVFFRTEPWIGSRFFKRSHLEATETFYARHGGKAVVIARFMPIVRTFAPFVAGVGNMAYGRFAMYNIVGATLWVGLFISGGYFFGNLALVKENFTLVILAIILISISPGAIEYLKHRLRRPRSEPA